MVGAWEERTGGGWMGIRLDVGVVWIGLRLGVWGMLSAWLGLGWGTFYSRGLPPNKDVKLSRPGPATISYRIPLRLPCSPGPAQYAEAQSPLEMCQQGPPP